MPVRDRRKLWFLIKEEDKEKLRQYQKQRYGIPLSIEKEEEPDVGVTFEPHYPTIEEIEKTMREKPSDMRRVE